MADYLISGHNGPLPPEAAGHIQRIANVLAGAGLRAVSLDDLERAALQNALDAAGGNRTHAAKLLGISVRTLQRKLKAQGNGSA